MQKINYKVLTFTLGWQRKPEAPVKELKNGIPPSEFYEKYVNTKTPVVLRGLAKNAGAITKWKDDATLKKM